MWQFSFDDNSTKSVPIWIIYVFNQTISNVNYNCYLTENIFKIHTLRNVCMSSGDIATDQLCHTTYSPDALTQ